MVCRLLADSAWKFCFVLLWFSWTVSTTAATGCDHDDDVSVWSDKFERDGVIRIPAGLSANFVDTYRQAANERFEQMSEAAIRRVGHKRPGDHFESDDTMCFAEVQQRYPGKYEVKMEGLGSEFAQDTNATWSFVNQPLVSSMASWAGVVRDALGNDAQLFSATVIFSTNQSVFGEPAPDQKWHADGPWKCRNCPESGRYGVVVYIPLEDVPSNGGKVQFLPKTHSTYELFSRPARQKLEKGIVSVYEPDMKAGDVLMWDFRLQHRGLACHHTTPGHYRPILKLDYFRRDAEDGDNIWCKQRLFPDTLQEDGDSAEEESLVVALSNQLDMDGVIRIPAGLPTNLVETFRQVAVEKFEQLSAVAEQRLTGTRPRNQYHSDQIMCFAEVTQRVPGKYEVKLEGLGNANAEPNTTWSFVNQPLISSNAAWAGVLRQTLGHDAELLSATVIFSTPQSVFQEPALDQDWHADGSWKCRTCLRPGRYAVVVYIPLEDVADEEGGKVQFVPKTHQSFELFTKDADQMIQEGRVVIYEPIMKAGDVLMWDFRLRHRGLARHRATTPGRYRPILKLDYFRKGKRDGDNVWCNEQLMPDPKEASSLKNDDEF